MSGAPAAPGHSRWSQIHWKAVVIASLVTMAVTLGAISIYEGAVGRTWGSNEPGTTIGNTVRGGPVAVAPTPTPSPTPTDEPTEEPTPSEEPTESATPTEEPTPSPSATPTDCPTSATPPGTATPGTPSAGCPTPTPSPSGSAGLLR
jgi:outer membrane biosynthesis protein TonB